MPLPIDDRLETAPVRPLLLVGVAWLIGQALGGRGSQGNDLLGGVLGAARDMFGGAGRSGRGMGPLGAGGLGALAGGAVGNYMDREEAKLRAQLQGTGVSVTRVGDAIILNMPGNVTFATDSSDISADFYPVLDSVALVINEFDQTYVDVMGQITGRPDPGGALFPVVDIVQPPLYDWVWSIPPEDRYSYVYRCSAEVLDHVVTSRGAGQWVAGVDYSRGNSDVSDVYEGQPDTALGSSDHDGMVVYLGPRWRRPAGRRVQP